MTFIPAIIGLEAFTLNLRIGVGDEERSKPQPIRITIACAVDIGAASTSDDLRRTVNYSLIRNEILDRSSTASYRLLERFAGEILEICFRHPTVRRCRVKVEKLTIFEDSVPFIETDWIDRAVYANMPAEAAE
jgi:FolB domain-containing protein